jgi:hypothetical protein
MGSASQARETLSTVRTYRTFTLLGTKVPNARDEERTPRRCHSSQCAAYEKAISLDDAFLDAHKNLAILCLTDNPTYQDRERTAKAMKHFQRYFDLGGKDPTLEQSYRQIKGFLDQAGR